MSDVHANHGHDSHAAPSHSMTKKLLNTVVLLGVPLGVVLGLVSAYKNDQPASSMSEGAVAGRIQKVGVLALGSGVRAPKSGEDVYKAQCTTCHAAGLLNAPKFGDAGAWGPRIATGYSALLTSALKGKGNMTAQGGGAFSNDEVGLAVVYMANAGGAKFEAPKAAKAPADAASAAKN